MLLIRPEFSFNDIFTVSYIRINLNIYSFRKLNEPNWRGLPFRHDITELLLKVALNTITLTPPLRYCLSIVRYLALALVIKFGGGTSQLFSLVHI
jgi:hypothetical protein